MYISLLDGRCVSGAGATAPFGRDSKERKKGRVVALYVHVIIGFPDGRSVSVYNCSHEGGSRGESHNREAVINAQSIHIGEIIVNDTIIAVYHLICSAVSIGLKFAVNMFDLYLVTSRPCKD